MVVRKLGKKRSLRDRGEVKRKQINAPNNKGAMARELREGADTAVRLLRDIKLGRVLARDLSANQRRGCLLLLANGTQTSPEMAAMFGVAASTIRKDLMKIRAELGREVREWTLEEVLGDLAMSADKCSAQAMRQEDPGLSWTIKRDFAKLLKDFGVVGSSDDRNSFSVTLEGIGQGYERARAALVKGLDPRLTGEVVEIEAEVTDPSKSLPPPLPLDRKLTVLAQTTEDQENSEEHEDLL